MINGCKLHSSLYVARQKRKKKLPLSIVTPLEYSQKKSSTSFKQKSRRDSCIKVISMGIRTVKIKKNTKSL
jgi:hypothetical protein